MKVNSKVVAIATLFFVLGGIFIAKGLGFWQTESSKEPMTFGSGEYEGQPMPDDIRGSYSFGDVENAFGVEAGIIAEAFNIEVDDPGEVLCKELEGIYADLGDDIEIGTGSVRVLIGLYTGLPYAEGDYLPDTAVEVLKANGKWKKEMETALDGYVVELGMESSAVISDVGEHEDEEEVEIAVKGNTTVADAISFGLTVEEIEDVLGVEVKNENMLLRDICVQNGIVFSEVKEKLNAMLE